jgi:hypothetical protein
MSAGVRAALGPVALLVGGLAAAGVARSAYGGIFALQWAELSRQIASLFVPQLNAVAAGLQRVVGWFQHLSGAQQETLRHLLLTGAGLLGVATVLPKIVAGFQAMTAVMTGARVALMALSAHPVIAIATAVGAVVTASYSLEEITSGLSKAFEVVGAVARPIFDALKDAVTELGGAIRQMGQALAEALGVKVPDDLKGFAKFVKDARFTKQQQQREEGMPEWMRKVTNVTDPFGIHHWLTNQLLARPMLEAPEKKVPHEELGPGGGQVESLEQTWRRLNAGAMRASATGMTEAQKQTDYQKRIAEATEKMAGTTGQDHDRPVRLK